MYVPCNHLPHSCSDVKATQHHLMQGRQQGHRSRHWNMMESDKIRTLLLWGVWSIGVHSTQSLAGDLCCCSWVCINLPSLHDMTGVNCIAKAVAVGLAGELSDCSVHFLSAEARLFVPVWCAMLVLHDKTALDESVGWWSPKT